MSHAPNRSTSQARVLMIAVAEQLFAERGLDGVSLREVGQNAGQRNNSAAQYHFGSRDGLLTAIITHRSGDVDGARARRIDALIASTPDPDLADLIRCFVAPLADMVDSGSPSAPTWYLRFLARVMESQAGHTAERIAPPAAHMLTLEKLVRDHTATIPAHTHRRRWRWLAQVTIRALADHEHEVAEGRRTPPIDKVVDDLVAMLVALLAAP